MQIAKQCVIGYGMMFFCNTDYYGTDAIYLHAFIVPTIVFIICSFIEYARSKSIEKPLIDLTYALLERIKWRF